MHFYKQTDGTYITAIGTSDTALENEITEQEYRQIEDALTRIPEKQSGKRYRLTKSLLWEPFDVPTLDRSSAYTRAELEGMSNAELETILWQYGITANMTKANLIRLILSAQGGDELV